MLLPPLRLSFFLLSLPCFFAAILASAFAVETRTVSLAWDPSPDASVTGYKLHYGFESGHPVQSVDVGNTLSRALTGLSAEIDYYFVVTAYDAKGIESAPSNEVLAPKLEVPASAPVPVPLTVALTSPEANAEFHHSSKISLKASVTGGEGIDRVDFYAGWTKIGEDPSSPYQLNWRAPTSGEYFLTARVRHRDGRTAASSVIPIAVRGGVWSRRPANGGRGDAPTLKSKSAKKTEVAAALEPAGPRGKTEGDTVVVEASSDFKAWEPVAIAKGAKGTKTFKFADPAKTYPRFYRVVTP